MLALCFASVKAWEPRHAPKTSNTKRSHSFGLRNTSLTETQRGAPSRGAHSSTLPFRDVPTMRARRLLPNLCFAFILVCCTQGQKRPLDGKNFGNGFSKGSIPGTSHVTSDIGPLEFDFILPGSGSNEGLTTGKAMPTPIVHPYTVSLRRRSDLRYICAGVLIGRRLVLTAAHCLDPSRPGIDSKPLVVVGSGLLSQTNGPGVQRINTKAAFLHPDYSSRRFPDLAIMELNSGASQTPIQLPTRFLLRRGDTLEVVGWGRQSPTSGNADVVQVVSLEFLPKWLCHRNSGRRTYSHELCMGGEGPSTCNGDNGGPIILPGQSRKENVLVGIVGDTHSCGAPNKPDIHTNIVPYLGWINSIAEIP